MQHLTLMVDSYGTMHSCSCLWKIYIVLFLFQFHIWEHISYNELSHIAYYIFCLTYLVNIVGH